MSTYLVRLGCRLVDGVDPSLNITYVVCAQVMRLTAVLDQPDHVVWLTEFVCQRGTETLQIDPPIWLDILAMEII